MFIYNFFLKMGSIESKETVLSTHFNSNEKKIQKLSIEKYFTSDEIVNYINKKI